MNRVEVQSPGRINLIGDHTDYTGGFVLPAAVDKKVEFTLEKTTENKVNLIATDIGESFIFSLNSFKPADLGWPNYIMGVVNEIQKTGAELSGFKATFSSDIPIGAGMSSSAAIECGLALGLNTLFNLKLDKWQIIKICQKAEHNFVGTMCGIMDQFASVMGRKAHFMLLDCRSLDFEYIPCDLGDYELILINSNVTHSLADSAYNKRRQECEEGLQVLKDIYPGSKDLRDITLEMLSQQEKSVRRIIYNRCLHVISENQRVLEACNALRNENYNQLGSLLYKSHESLDKLYDVSCPELNFLVQFTKDLPYVLGSRMMGGGFGGCTINLVKKEKSPEFTKAIMAAYQKRFKINPVSYHVKIGDGTSLVS